MERNDISARKSLLALIRQKAYQRGNFLLASGKTSHYYIDARKITLDPQGAYLVGELFFNLLKNEPVSAVGGLTLGADPIVSSIAITSFLKKRPIPVFIVRKEAKGHGTQKMVEGTDLISGQRIILVDDVLTTGGSFLEAAEKIQPMGVKIGKLLCIVDRREKNQRTRLLEPLGIPIESLFTIEEIEI